MNILYPAKIKFNKSDKRYFIQFLDFDEAISEAETLDEALANAQDVLTLTLEARMDEGIEIPEPKHSKAKNVFYITPSARVQAALLFKRLKDLHTNAEIARALNTSWPAIARIEDPHHWPSLRQLERVASAIGQRLILSFESTNEMQQHKHVLH